MRNLLKRKQQNKQTHEVCQLWKVGLSDSKILAIVLVILAAVYSCVQPFSPPEISAPSSYLVVDGFLNTGQDSSFIELRRTQNINELVNPVVETGALLSVESENGEAYSFAEMTNGKYALPPRQFDQTGKYRLRIETSNGAEYLSEYVIVTKTPPLDSISYKIDPVRNAMVFYANAQDPQNKTHFYRWKFEETWEYESTYASALEVVGGEVVLRKENITRCWRTDKSSNIILGSTIKQTSDIIKELPINSVPISTNKLYIKYSILMKQYALSREAFEYWTTLSKTTQLTGSLFDPLPSLLTGNIRSTTNSADLVFGYFSASTEAKKRILIKPGLGAFPRCTEPDTLPIKCSSMEAECGLRTPLLLLSYWGARSDSVTAASADCTDCRLQGGTTMRPSFWE